jgi:hypothetical protein
MKSTGIAFLISIITLIVTGCTSAWEQFYTKYDDGNSLYIPAYSGVTQVYRVSGLAEAKSIQNNFKYTLGESSFCGSPGWAVDCSYESLQKYGQKIGADVIAYWVENVSSETRYSTRTTYTPSPSQTYVSGYSYGNQFYGNATTYGGGGYATSYTTPYQVYYGEFHALFLRGQR